MSPFFGGIRRRLAVVILLTALIPVSAAIGLARSMVDQAIERFYVPEVGQRLDEALGLYAELAREVKSNMREQAASIAGLEPLRRAALKNKLPELQQLLEQQMAEHPALVSLAVRANDETLSQVSRSRPADDEEEHQLEVIKALDATESHELVATFATKKERFMGLEQMSEFVDSYKALEQRRELDEKTYVRVFAILLGGTIVLAFGVGSLLARSGVQRLRTLAVATQKLGSGDLTIRVPDSGTDEISELAGAFNRMVGEVEQSRARIDYLQRIATWQELARRLAHEIKNPLTPIQLAVQEVHQRYKVESKGEPERQEYKKVLDDTLEIVQAEIGTLRRLVTEFSDFARLPQAELVRLDMLALLRAEQSHYALFKTAAVEGDLKARAASSDRDAALIGSLDLTFAIPSGETQVLVDEQLFHRVLFNLIRNAAQAIASRRLPALDAKVGKVEVSAEVRQQALHICVDDNGPGIPDAMLQSVFDPYVTTKTEGTGLGLAIVKKIVMEHNGRIDALSSPLGGARIKIELPVADAHS